MRVRLVFRRSWVQSSGPATFVRGDWSWNHFYGHSLPIPGSSRAIVSFLWKDVHCLLINHLGLSLPRKSVDRLTDRHNMTIVVDWDVKEHSNKQTIDQVSFELHHEKSCLCHMQTTKAQISLHIWSAPLLFVAWIVWIPPLTIAKISDLASLISWAGRFESYLVANPEDRFSSDGAHLYFLFIYIMIFVGTIWQKYCRKSFDSPTWCHILVQVFTVYLLYFLG